MLPDVVLRVGIVVSSLGYRGGPYFEDIFPLDVSIPEAPPAFKEEGEPKKAYWVVATDERILKIELVRVAVRMPQYEVVAPYPADDSSGHVYFVDGGVLVHTAAGILAAVPHFPFFGFKYESQGNGPFIELVGPEEALRALPEAYQLIAIV